ncbi:MAG TPA: thioredoxin [Candidatus Omnitrophica bacterium]|nr:thioredoxin [Candidatus Omnitrophota bacterium]
MLSGSCATIITDVVDKSLIFDVNEENFEESVILTSCRCPVIVDFWAPWCLPCRILTPTLENIVRSYDGKVILAKMNVDENRTLASLFGIRGIPAVKIFKNGEIVEEFVGALPNNDIREIIASVAPTEADLLVEEGDRLRKQGKIFSAEEKYRLALENIHSHPPACLRLAELSFKKNDYKEAKELIARIPVDRPEYAEAEKISFCICLKEKCAEFGGLKACKERVKKEPQSLDAHFTLATCLAAEGKYAEALEEFLKVVQVDKYYQNAAARRAMLEIFSIVGQDSNLVKKYRSRLASAIY